MTKDACALITTHNDVTAKYTPAQARFKSDCHLTGDANVFTKYYTAN